MTMYSRLSNLWIFLTLNFLYCDVLALHQSSYLQGLLSGEVDGVKFTAGMLLGFSILMEIPISLVLLSRILKYRLNRWLNVVAAVLMIVVQSGTLFVGSAPTPSYIFFSVIEILTLLIIVRTAWKWKNEHSPAVPS